MQGSDQVPEEPRRNMHPHGPQEEQDMTTSMIADLGSLSFWRIAAVPFDAYVAALDSWLPAKHGGELWFGGSQMLAPIEHDRDPGPRRIQGRLARGRLHLPLRMRLDIDRWSASSTALELIPCRLVRPAPEYFRAGRLLLDSLTRSLLQAPEPWVTRSIAA